MKLALYCPVYGFYEAEKDTIGAQGDYFTSVSVGNLFGELLAFQFAEWLPHCATPESDAQSRRRPVLVEAGAHDARLAQDILGWLRRFRPEIFKTIEYWIVEPSPSQRQRQQRTLADHLQKVRWVGDLDQIMPARTKEQNAHNLCAIIFSNELFDAMPVHRLEWDADKGAWFEWGVALDQDRLVWKPMDPVLSETALLGTLPQQLLNTLPNGFVFEVGVAAENWWRRAARLLGQGKLLTIDYGMTLEESLLPERSQGTLRAYSQHRVSLDLLADPGHQDLTASVNFSALRSAGETEGLKTEAFLTQETFLTRIASKVWTNGDAAFGEWTSDRTRQFQTLTNPEHLGRRFQVLVQSIG